MLSEQVPEPATRVADAAALVRHGDGSLLVIGAAGAGKSRLLRDRFVWLVEQGTPAERIALVLSSPAHADAARAALEAGLRGGYSELVALTPAGLATSVLRRGAGGWRERDAFTLGRSERLAMLAERIDELPLSHHDFGGNTRALLVGFVRRIDRLKAERIDAECFAAWAQRHDNPREREFAAIFRAHERMLRETGACDESDAIMQATALLGQQQADERPFAHVLVDDAQELDLAATTLVRALAPDTLTLAGDPGAALARFRGAGAARLRSFAAAPTRVVTLTESHRCAGAIKRAAQVVAEGAVAGGRSSGEPAREAVSFWRCESERAQAQAVAAEIERLVVHDRVDPGRIAVLLSDAAREGQAVAIALDERALPHRLIGDGGFFQRAEVRDLLAWLRLLGDSRDAAAIVRALARAPIALRSVDIARCTQIARRRRIDMIAALGAATESPQLPPEARERIRVFLELHSACAEELDTLRPDLYVHRLIERLGLRRQQLFTARAEVVERLRALARFGELAQAHVTRAPQATAREFARAVVGLAEWGLSEHEEPAPGGADAVQVLSIETAGGLEFDHVYVLGLRAALARSASLASEPVADELLHEPLPADDEATRRSRLRQRIYVAITRARERVVLIQPGSAAHGGGAEAALEEVELARQALGAEWVEIEEDLFGPAETLHATHRLLRDELMDGTSRAASRLAELRLDTDLDVSHAVVRYLELLKVAALIARAESDPDHGLGEALRDINARIEQAVTADQREIFASSPLDQYLLDAERDVRHRARVVAVRDEPSLARFLPMRGEGVMLSATDIETYRSCPLRYKFARVFRIPQEPTLHQRFGIVVHQVLERYHKQATTAELGPLAELLSLLDASWRRAGLGDSDEERQLRRKATAALTRYHERAQAASARPVWFERQFSFRLGPHLVRGRVDRVDLLQSGEYELIDYKTGRPRSAEQLAADVQLSLYALAAREAWGLEAARGVYHYLLDDERVTVASEPERVEWVREVAVAVAEGVRAQEFEPTPGVRACGLCDYRLLCPAVER